MVISIPSSRYLIQVLENLINAAYGEESQTEIIQNLDSRLCLNKYSLIIPILFIRPQI